MIVDQRFITYLRSLDVPQLSYLARLEQEALEDQVPIIRKDTQHFLRFLMQTLQPREILEVGTAVGYSALFMEAYDPVSCHITTIENYEPRIRAARKNFREAGKEEQITLIEGDAAEVLPTLTESYDFIFMDAAKGQYPVFFPYLKDRMKKGGVMLTDNILQEGDLIESRYAVERRDRTIHKRMREYLYTLTHDEDLVCTILPVGDGLAVCTRK